MSYQKKSATFFENSKYQEATLRKSSGDSFAHALMWQEVREALRKSRLTHAELAQKMGVSVPTIRRWLGGGAITFSKWVDLIKIVGLSLTEIEKKLLERNGDRFTYSEAQERAFANNSSVLAIFDMLLNGADVPEVLKRSVVTLASFRRHLKVLEDLNLIVRLPNDRVKIIPRGEPVWRKNGPLQRAFSKFAMDRFLQLNERDVDSKIAYKKFKSIYIKNSDISGIQSAIDEFFSKISRFEASERAVSFDEKTRVALFFKVNEFSFEFLENIDEC